MDSLNETLVKGDNLIRNGFGSSESEENSVSCEMELPESETSEPICKKRCVDALLHSDIERMRRERIKDCCDQLRMLLPYVKGRRTDVASILEMTVEYMRYIYGRIPSNVISQIIEIFQTNTRYCKYVWKPNDGKYSQNQLPPRIGLVPRKSVFTDDSSEKVKLNAQFALCQYTENEYFKNHNTVAAGHMMYNCRVHEAAFEANQYSIPVTERLVPQIQTNILSPNIPPSTFFPFTHDVQNISLPNLTNISIFPSAVCPNGSYPMFTNSNGSLWSTGIARSDIGPSSLLSSSNCSNYLSSLPSDYSANPFSIACTSPAQTAGRNVQLCTVDSSSSSVILSNGTNHTLPTSSVEFPAKPFATDWTTNRE
ncbi:uncharacterized protein LOC125483338 isoform X2 [Rhincodon typus]|nr:uncharacterized protein LOC125483338 isoform X2 [Rhincodon typus]